MAKLWTRERVLAELRRLSKDGVAPPSKRVPRLESAAWRLFGSWAAACRAAGVATWQEVHGYVRQRPMRRSAHVRSVAIWLALAARLGVPPAEAVEGVLGAYARGELPPIA